VGRSEGRSHPALSSASGVDEASGFARNLEPAIVDVVSIDDAIAFRHAMEGVFRERLGRVGRTTFVGMEEAAEGLLQYFRYRMNGCEEPAAGERALARVRGLGIQPVCGIVEPRTGTTVAFGDDAVRFRHRLEAEYRDGLGRPASLSAFPIEDEVAWFQEYLRERFRGSTHEEVLSRVLRITGV
jgi:hypothetical protein